MRELLRTNDPVLIARVTAMLGEVGIAAIVLDTHMSILEGSVGAIPRRVMVSDEDLAPAQRLLSEIRNGDD